MAGQGLRTSALETLGLIQGAVQRGQGSLQLSEEEATSRWDVDPQGALNCIEGALAVRRPWWLLITGTGRAWQQRPGLGTARRGTQDEEDDGVMQRMKIYLPFFLRPVWE